MAKRGGFAGGMPGNMNNMIKQAQRMQRKLEEQQKELEEKQKEFEEKEFNGTAGGGAVSVAVSGKKLVTKVTIDPDACDPDDVETLEELVMLAVNDALNNAEAANAELMGSMQPDMGLGGLGLGGMGFGGM